MKKYIPILIGIFIGYFISLSNCSSPLSADTDETSDIGKYQIAMTGSAQIYTVIIDTETGIEVSRTTYDWDDFTHFGE